MSTNYRVTTPKQFFDQNQIRENENSVFDQLSAVLKSSLYFVWNYVKTIDVKGSIQQGLEGNNLNEKESKFGLSKNNSQSNDHHAANKEHKIQEPELVKESQNALSKREKLKEKKERKKISFDEFEKYQEKKVNESFIRKNIEIKKVLNKSLQSQQPAQLEENDLVLKEKNIIKNHEQKVADHNNNHNESLILNISDIDSEFNFNILNNSNLNESLSVKDEHLRAEFLKENEDEEGSDGVNEGQIEANVPKLELKEYPFLGHNIRMSYRAKINKNEERRNSISSKTNNKTNSNKSKEKISTTNEPDHYENDYIDVDALYYPPLEHNPEKRIPAPFIKSNESEIRKKVKYSQQQQINENGQKLSSKMIEKQEKFDRLVASRYEKIMEGLNIEKEQDKEQKFSLKEDYEKFLQKNFASAIFEKQKIEKEGEKFGEVDKNTLKKLKFSEYLKPIDYEPEIMRKKLYTFTKECESKISISEELKKSVLQDKQRQFMEEMKRKQEEEMIRKKEQEEIRKRQEEEMRRRQEEEKKLKEKEQEEQKVTEELIKQRSGKEEGQQETLPESNQTDEVKPGSKEALVSPKSEQSKEKTEKEPAKSLGLFDAPKTSLFSLAEKKPSEEKLPELSRAQYGEKEDEATKKSSIIEGKSNEEIKAKEAVEENKPVELVSKPSETEVQKKPEPAKHNPFLAPAKTQNVTLLQELINSKKDDASMFKSITATPLAGNSPQRQAPSLNPNSFLSPVHNTSQYSNLDSSMCEESESNITPGNSQTLQNNVLPGANLNGSILNASFSSHTGSVFPGNSTSLFNGPVSNPLFNTSSYNPTGQTSGLFGNAPSQTPSGGLFGAQQQSGFMSAQAAKIEAINKVPSFMQNQPMNAPTISSQAAVSLFSQRSPSKNEPQSSLFGPTPSIAPTKPSSSRRNQKKEERIR